MKKVLSLAMLVLSLCMVGCFSQSKDDSENDGTKLTKAVAPFTVDNAITVFYKRTKRLIILFQQEKKQHR